MSNRDMAAFAAGVLVLGLCAGILIGALLWDKGPEPLADPFTDTAGHPYAWAIEEIRLAGLTAGCQTEPAMYCPDRPLTRGEAAVMLARLLEK